MSACADILLFCLFTRDQSDVEANHRRPGGSIVLGRLGLKPELIVIVAIEYQVALKAYSPSSEALILLLVQADGLLDGAAFLIERLQIDLKARKEVA